MAIFKRQQPTRTMTPPPWQPIIDMSTARPAVLTLAKAHTLGDAEKRSAIKTLAQLSGRPSSDTQLMMLIRNEPNVLQRPWRWLIAVMREAAGSGDHYLAVAGLFWSCHWTADLVPLIGVHNLGAFMDIELDPISPELKREILAVGVASARQLPEDFVIFDDGTNQVWAADVAEASAGLLGI